MSTTKILAAAVVIGAVALTHQIRPLNVLAYSLVAMLVLSFVWSRLSVRGLRLRRDVRTTRVQVGEAVEERISLLNHSPAPRLWLHVQDLSTLPGHSAERIVDLEPRGARTWRAQTVCRRRGEYLLGPSTLVGADPLGLFPARRHVSGATRVLVYPQTVELLDFVLPFADEHGGNRQVAGLHQTTAHAAETREYSPGDPLKRIHWRTTARLSKLMVKEFDEDPTADVWIFLDLDARVHRGEGDESTVEYAVKAASSLGKHFLDRNRNVGLVASGRRRSALPADRGDRQLIRLLEELAVVQADGGAPLAEVLLAEGHRCQGRSVALIITPSLDQAWVGSLRALRYQGVRGVAVVVEPGSFDGGENSLPLASALAAADLPLHLIRQGDNLSQALRGDGLAGVAR